MMAVRGRGTRLERGLSRDAYAEVYYASPLPIFGIAVSMNTNCDCGLRGRDTRPRVFIYMYGLCLY